MVGVSGRSFAQRNDRFDIIGTQLFAQPMGVESFVADQSQAVDIRHERVKGGDVVTLARQQDKADKIAERVGDYRNLRGQAATRLADRLILSPPFAPVPC